MSYLSENQTVLRAEMRVGFQAAAQGARRMHAAILNITDHVQELPLTARFPGYSHYTVGRREIDRDRRRHE